MFYGNSGLEVMKESLLHDEILNRLTQIINNPEIGISIEEMFARVKALHNDSKSK